MPPKPIVFVIDDSDDETASERACVHPVASSSKLPEADKATEASSLSSLISDRAQLERERMQRARKRRRDQGIISSDDEEDKEAPPAKKAQAAVRFTNKKAAQPITVIDRFWDGTIKHSFNRYAAKVKEGSTFASMLLPCTPSASRGLKQVVMATYDLRMDWLYAHFPRDVKVTLILNPSGSNDPEEARPGLHPTVSFPAFVRYPGWTICVPRRPKGGWLTQHIKFLFLIHDDFVRVAILSGNLNGFDWERIENTAFIQDFPFASPSPIIPDPPKSDFREQLERVLKSLSLPRTHEVYAVLKRCDFSKAKAKIVASWPEAAPIKGWDAMESQGLARLGKVVRSLGVKGNVTIEAQGSSLANHDKKWLEHFHVLASGFNPRGVIPLKGKPHDIHKDYFAVTKRKPTGDREKDGFETKGYPPIKIMFPTQKWVENTAVEGPNGAGTFFGKAKEFRESPIKHLYHLPRGRRGDVMIHAKAILAVLTEQKETVDLAFSSSAAGGSRLDDQGEENPIGWTYLGSHNFTRAAWGNIGGSASDPTMSNMNWELGVILPIYKSEVSRLGVEAECLRAITYQRPAPSYGPTGTPWDNATIPQ